MRARQPWCSNCGATHDLVVDHVMPIHLAGTDHPDNLQVLCRSCNAMRTSGFTDDDRRGLWPPVPQFHRTGPTPSLLPRLQPDRPRREDTSMEGSHPIGVQREDASKVPASPRVQSDGRARGARGLEAVAAASNRPGKGHSGITFLNGSLPETREAAEHEIVVTLAGDLAAIRASCAGATAWGHLR